jgi:predicted phage terminase large subunit-like protein
MFQPALTRSFASSPAFPFGPAPADVLAARKELARRSLPDFACMVDIPTVPLGDSDQEDQFSVMRLDALAAHHALLLRALQDLEAGRIQNLMVLMPPGSAKSTYSDVVFVPWFMARRARSTVILASYASDIAKKQGRRARQLISSRSFTALTDLTLHQDQKAADQWALSNGSEFMAGGLTSGLTGNRGALGILDDPIKGRLEAESENNRNATWDAYIDDFCSRLTPGAPQVIITTRWHEDDPAGRILPPEWDGESGMIKGRDGRLWRVICLPAEADRADDPLGRKLGESLWPEWFGQATGDPADHWRPFKQYRRTWNSLYQQKPAPHEGTFFQKAWFKRYRKGGEPKHLNKYISSDHAPAGQDSSDYNCVRVWGVDAEGDLWLLDGFRRQCKLDVLADETVGNKRPAHGAPPIEGLIAKHRPFCWFPEDDNNWKAAAPFIAKQMQEQGNYCRIEPISPHGQDKPTKAQSFQGMAANGRVWIPVGPEGDEVLDLYAKFPAGKYDDEIDAASVIGRAICEAHPAVVPAPQRSKFVDRWDRKFNDGAGDDDWKTK